MEEFVEMKWELHLATAVFICAHCIRTPNLLRNLLSLLKRRNRPSRLSQLILELETILSEFDSCAKFGSVFAIWGRVFRQILVEIFTPLL